MGTHNIIDCAVIGVCAVIRSNTVMCIKPHVSLIIYMVNVLKFWTLYSILFWLKCCFLCSCFLKCLVEWQTVLTLTRLLRSWSALFAYGILSNFGVQTLRTSTGICRSLHYYEDFSEFRIFKTTFFLMCILLLTIICIAEINLNMLMIKIFPFPNYMVKCMV